MPETEVLGPPGAAGRSSTANGTGMEAAAVGAPGATGADGQGSWHEGNLRYLDLRLARLRRLITAEVDRLRHTWRDDDLRSEGIITDAEADGLLAQPRHPDGTKGMSAPDDHAIAAQERWLLAHGGPPALLRLGARLGLDATDLDIVVLCLAPHLDPGFARLYAYAADDGRRTLPTPDLARRVLGERAGLVRFLGGRPLRDHAIVHVDDGADSAPLASQVLRLDERTVAFLLGEEAREAALDGILGPVPTGPRTEAHETVARTLVEFLREEESVPAIDLRGRPGAGRRAVAHAVAAGLGVRLGAVHAGRLPPPGPERARLVRLLRRESLLARTALMVDADGEAPPADVVASGALCIVRSDGPWPAPDGVLRVDVPVPDARDQASLWQAVLAPQATTEGIDAAWLAHLAQQVRVGPTDMPALAAEADRTARLAGRAMTPDDLWRACRDQVGAAMGDAAQRIEPCASMEDLVLPADARAQLQEIVDQVRLRFLVYDGWGLARPDARGRGISVLFSGASGTGKTMAAEVLARELGLELYRIDLAGVVSKYVGETEKNLRRVFDGAERAGVLLFFDEADALFTNRTDVKDSHDRYANLEVDYLLQRMEAYQGLAVLATNRKAAMDAAFLRRLRFHVLFPFPDETARQELWRRAFPPAVRPELEWDRLARLELTGAGIRNTALNAAFLAASRTPPRITHEDIVHAARREFAKMDRTPDKAALAPVRGRT